MFPPLMLLSKVYPIERAEKESDFYNNSHAHLATPSFNLQPVFLSPLESTPSLQTIRINLFLSSQQFFKL
jgi:hypothetical protein